MTTANRLANEQFPYLLQHTQNPVDWYPWGNEAFFISKSRRQAHIPLDRLFYLLLVSHSEVETFDTFATDEPM